MKNEITTDKLASDKDYEARGIIAKIQPIGNIQLGMLVAQPIYKYLTLDRGKGIPALLVKFKGKAPMTPEKELDYSKLRLGDIVVNPGLLYQKAEWTGALMTQHLAALKYYRPSVIVTQERDTITPATDIVIDPLGLSKN